jgi:hypothetical protein
LLSLRRPSAELRPLRVAAGAGVDSKIVNGEDFPAMKDLIKLYKTAFLDGNDGVLGEIEKAIAALKKRRAGQLLSLKV